MELGFTNFPPPRGNTEAGTSANRTRRPPPQQLISNKNIHNKSHNAKYCSKKNFIFSPDTVRNYLKTVTLSHDLSGLRMTIII